MTNSGLICGANIVTPDGILSSSDLLFIDGVIAGIGKDLDAPANTLKYIARDKYLLPGFIDIHYHGSAGFDATFGTYSSVQDQFGLDAEQYRESLIKATQHRVQHGVTKMLLTSMAAPVKILQQAFQFIADAVENDEFLRHTILGINLEGTFLKNPAYAGAQNPDFFQPAESTVLEQLHRASGDRIKVVNVPPEHDDRGLELMETAKDLGMRIAAGHTGATFDQTMRAVAAGLSLGVHFLNGPALTSKKSFHGGGAEEAMLWSDDIFLELIIDGYHVHPTYVRDVLARKEASRIIGISDAMFATGLSLDEFTVAGLKGRMSKDRTYLQSQQDPNTLFGSVLEMDRGFSNLVSWLTTGQSGFWTREHEAMKLEDAICTASQICSTNPANYLDLLVPEVEKGTGLIEVGKKADLIIGEVNKSAGFDLSLKEVFCEGVAS